MALRRPLVRLPGQNARLPVGDFLELERIAVVDGSTSPNPGGSNAAGVQAWSTTYGVLMRWSGAAWRVADVPNSLNAVPAGETVVIPRHHNLLTYGPLIVDGDLVLDGNLIPVA